MTWFNSWYCGITPGDVLVCACIIIHALTTWHGIRTIKKLFELILEVFITNTKER